MEKGHLVIFIGLVVLLLLGGGGYWAYSHNFHNIRGIHSYEDCGKAGYPVMASYPGQCNTPDGQHFVQELSEKEKKKLVSPSLIKENETVAWKTYINKKYKYSIENPGENVLLKGNEDSDYVSIGDVYLSITSHNPENFRGDCSYQDKVSDVLINGLKVRKIEGRLGNIGGFDPQAYQDVVIFHNDLYYIFSTYEFHNSSFDGRPNVGEAKFIIPKEKIVFLNKVLANFKFTE